VKARESVCQATRVRGEQSEALLDLRMECLDDQLDEVRAFADVLLTADAQALDRAANALRSLPPLGECATLHAEAALRPVAPELRPAVERLKRRLDDSKALAKIGRFREAQPIIDEVLADPAIAADPAFRAVALLARGKLLNYEAHFDEATPALKEAVRAGLESRNDRAAADAFVALGILSGQHLVHLDEGLEWLALAASMSARLGHPDDLEIDILRHRSGIYDNNGKEAEAEVAARQALALAERTLAADDVQRAWLLDGVAGAIANHRPEEALAMELRAIDVLEKGGVDQTSSGAGMLYNIALTYDVLRRPADTERMLRRALAIEERLLDPDHPQIVAARVLLGGALLRQGRLDEAEKSLRETLPMAQKRSAEFPVGEPEILWGLGDIRAQQHRYGEAIPLLEKALAHPTVGPDMGEVRFALAQALWGAGDRRRAVAQAEQSRSELQVHPSTLPELDKWQATHKLK
jgi:tetratricopeptide (TPR) repeat protein